MRQPPLEPRIVYLQGSKVKSTQDQMSLGTQYLVDCNALSIYSFVVDLYGAPLGFDFKNLYYLQQGVMPKKHIGRYLANLDFSFYALVCPGAVVQSGLRKQTRQVLHLHPDGCRLSRLRDYIRHPLPEYLTYSNQYCDYQYASQAKRGEQ